MGISYSDKKESQEGLVLPGSENPCFSVSPASQNHDKLIGSMNPSEDGGLVGRQFLLLPRRRRDAYA